MLYNLLYSEKEEGFSRAYSEVEGKIRSAVGEQVLVVENRINASQHGGADATVTTFLELGILTSSFEKNDLGEIALPMEKYAQRRSGHNPSKWELVDGTIKVQLHRLGRIGQDVEQVFPARDCTTKGLSVYTPALSFKIGKEIENYFISGETIRINKSPLARKISGGVDKSYLEALELLGLEIPVHLESFEDYIKRRDRKIENLRAKYI